MEVGPANVEVRSTLTLGVGPLQANLDRVFAFCRRSPSACDAEVGRYVSGVVEVYRDGAAPPTKERVRVVLRPAQYMQMVEASLGASGAEAKPIARPFVDGLLALAVLNSPRALRPLGERDARQLGLTSQELFDVGLANLRASLPPLMDIAKPVPKGVVGQMAGDIFHPSRLLFVATWAPLAEAQGGTLIVALPATDVLLYVSDDAAASLETLRSLANDVISRAPNKLSTSLLRWRPTGWDLVAP